MSDLHDMNEHIERLSRRIGTLNELHAAYAARSQIIERDRRLSICQGKLRELAGECAECDGTGRFRATRDDPEIDAVPCTACADIRALLA